jgi:hypothetical protein
MSKQLNTTEKPSATAEKIAHTQGDWTIRGKDQIVVKTDRGTHLQIAQVFETSMFKDEPEHLESDARLIAAAPEQHESLTALVNRLEHTLKIARGLGTLFRAEAADEIKAARAAIAKAEGKVS